MMPQFLTAPEALSANHTHRYFCELASIELDYDGIPKTFRVVHVVVAEPTQRKRRVETITNAINMQVPELSSAKPEVWRRWEHVGDALVWASAILSDRSTAEVRKLFDAVEQSSSFRQTVRLLDSVRDAIRR